MAWQFKAESEEPTPQWIFKPEGESDSSLNKFANPLQNRFEELKGTAGARGSTFAGRLVPQESTETAPEVLSRIPLGELESAASITFAPQNVAAGIGLAGGALRLGAHPIETLRAGRAAYEAFADKVGATILDKTPTFLRSGRGAPIEFREARMQMEADIANSTEQAIVLGKTLKKDMSLAEKLRADQLLRGQRAPTDPRYGGEIATGATPAKITEAVKPVRAAIDKLQDELKTQGGLSEDTVNRFGDNFGPYFPRLYASKEFVEHNPVMQFPKPTRAGTPRLLTRGERVEVEIPSLEKEMQGVARLIGPEAEFKRTFREAARDLAKRRETITEEKSTNIFNTQTSTTSKTTAGGEGEFTEVPLSGIAARLEKVVSDALVTRGMTEGEAAAAIGRVKSAAVKVAQAGPEVKITGGGTTNTVTETIRQTAERETQIVKTVIENLGVNNAQKAALHAYYDAISRAGAKTKSVKVGDRTYKIAPIMDAESATERVESLAPLLKAGFTVEKRIGNKVTMFRDIPEATRKEMGELRSEPGYVAAKGLAQVGREVAVRKFFRKVAENPEWVSPIEAPGFTMMPKDNKRLVDLAGKFVRSDIAAEIDDVTRIKGDWEKVLNRINSLWKIQKVVNPATIARNFMTSAEIARWGDMSYVRPSGIRSYSKAVQGLLGKDKDAAALIQEAKDNAVFRASWQQGEIGALADGFAKSKDSNVILRVLDGVSNAVEKSGMPAAYGSVDNFFKTALYIHGRVEQGLSPTLAARYARKWGVDYGDVSPAVKFLRDVPLGSPFITWGAKMIPLAAETMVKHPIRFWGLPAALWGVNSLSKKEFDAQEIDSIQKLGALKPPRHILLPGKSAEGRNRFLDLGYMLPIGDLIEIFDRMTGGESANTSFEPLGGPWQGVMEASFNKSLFTGKPIYLQSDTAPEVASKIADHLGKSLFSPLAPPIPFTGFRGGYSTEAFRKAVKPEFQLPGEAPISAEDYLGRSRSLLSTIAAKILGVNVKEVSLDDVQKLGLFKFQARSNEIAKQMARTMLSKITDEQKQVEIKNLDEKFRALGKEMQEKFGTPATQKEWVFKE